MEDYHVKHLQSLKLLINRQFCDTRVFVDGRRLKFCLILFARCGMVFGQPQESNGKENRFLTNRTTSTKNENR